MANEPMLRLVRNSIVGQFVRFCTTGVLNTAVNFSVYWILLVPISFHYLFAGGIGYFSGAVVGFYINRRWTFRATVSSRRGLPIYMAVQVVSLGAHIVTQWTVVAMFGVPDVLSQLFGIAVTTFINFALSRRFAFNMREER